jgi:hypothetical protein
MCFSQYPTRLINAFCRGGVEERGGVLVFGGLVGSICSYRGKEPPPRLPLILYNPTTVVFRGVLPPHAWSGPVRTWAIGLGRGVCRMFSGLIRRGTSWAAGTWFVVVRVWGFLVIGRWAGKE